MSKIIVWRPLYQMPLNKPIPDSVINYWKNGRDIQSTERVGKDLDILDSISYGDKVRTEQTRQEQQQRPNPLDSMPIATNDYGECVDTLLDSMNESDTNW